MKSSNRQFLYGFIFCVILIYFLIELKNNCFFSGYNKKEIIQKLSRQAARWSTAAKQDKSLLIGILHANYGTGYLWALKDIATASEIKNATGISLTKFTNEIVKTQDEITRKMIIHCPGFAPQKDYLSILGGENT